MNNSKNNNRTIEDQLADFTDRILERTTEEGNGGDEQNPELRALEQTALRLKSAFHDEGPSDEVIQNMRQNIILEWKRRKSQASKSFWRNIPFVHKPHPQKWQSQRDHQRRSMFKSLAVVAVVMGISVLLLNEANFNQPAAARGQNLNFGVLAVTSALLLALWIFRRKQ